MRTRFELGEEVYVKAKIIRIGLHFDNKVGDCARYDLAVKTSRGETLSINYLSEDQIESVVQK